MKSLFQSYGIAILFIVATLSLCSCNEKTIDKRNEFGKIYSVFDKELNDTVFYIAYADTVINDTIRSLYKEYRCEIFDSLCSEEERAIIFREEHVPDFDVAMSDGNYEKADSIDQELYKAVVTSNSTFIGILNHLDRCHICKEISNKYRYRKEKGLLSKPDLFMLKPKSYKLKH